MRYLPCILAILLTSCASTPKLSAKAKALNRLEWNRPDYLPACQKVKDFRAVPPRKERECEILFNKYVDYLDRSVDAGATHLHEPWRLTCNSLDVDSETFKCPKEVDLTETQLEGTCEARNGTACYVLAITRKVARDDLALYEKGCGYGNKESCDYVKARKELATYGKYETLCLKKSNPRVSCTRASVYFEDREKPDKAQKMIETGCQSGVQEHCETLATAKMLGMATMLFVGSVDNAKPETTGLIWKMSTLSKILSGVAAGLAGARYTK